MENSKIAQRLLSQREKGVSIKVCFYALKGRMLFRLILILIFIGMYLFGIDPTLAIFGIGFVLGMFVQDFSWFQAITKSWNSFSKFINWPEVEDVAGKNS